MSFLQSFFQGLVDMGAPVFLAIILALIGIIFRMKVSRALSAGLTLGVALVGISLVVDFMITNVGTASKEFVENTGIELGALDMGWPPALGLAWTWEFAFLMFPIQIIVNIIMLAFRWTSCVNVDMWNVGNKVCTAFLVSYVSGHAWLGLLFATLQAVLELINADITKYRLQKLTGIPGVSMPHPMFLTGIWIYPIVKIMDKLIPATANLDAQKVREKVGIFGENHIMGFIVGCLIGLFGGYGYKETLTLGVQAGAALTLFPLVAKLFTTALTPISESATSFMKNRFKDREFSIGLDWPIMAGRPEHWLIMILTIPILLVYALILPGNLVLPFGGLMNICIVVPFFFLTQGNLVKMAIGTIISIPMQLYVATYFAPHFTALAGKTGGVETPEGQMLAWFGMDISELRYIFAEVSQLSLAGIILFVATIFLSIFYYKGMKKDEEQFKVELGIDSTDKGVS
ncbi:PTS galactitol transporter subunit IIC [Cytobacillus gottheilii]|uniref:PTS galactitol transporter subunit IIC n=1 Tax=Cytobacillus gottheilii TaxID=859144 RepID=UPI0009BB202D|nr:PTS transporter subunit IIC [Cytobacillus gottheilii]